jgi:hypothetical protein
MAWVATGALAVSVVGGYINNQSQSDSAASARDAQTTAANMSITEQRRQFDELRKMMLPYAQAGQASLGAQQNLIGLYGAGAQQQAIDGIKNSAQFGELNAQGQNAILQNASATGGLRGGNVQAALAQFSPQLLNGLINQQYQQLGGITSLGQNAASGIANAGMQSAQQFASQQGQIGAAQAGASLAQGRADQQLTSGIAGAVGQGLGYFGGGGGVAALPGNYQLGGLPSSTGAAGLPSNGIGGAVTPGLVGSFGGIGGRF